MSGFHAKEAVDAATIKPFVQTAVAGVFAPGGGNCSVFRNVSVEAEFCVGPKRLGGRS